MEVAKDTPKQEKRRFGVGSTVGGAAVWGGVAVIAVTFVAASLSAFKSRRKRNNQTTRQTNELNKIRVNEEGDTASMEYDTRPLEIISKMIEDKVDHEKEALNKDKEKNIEEDTNNNEPQKDHLEKDQLNSEKIEADEESVVALPKTNYIESVKVGDKNVKKDEELAEEIEVDTPLGDENEEESDENSSIDENGEDISEKDLYLQNLEEQQEENDSNGTVESEEQAVEIDPELNIFANEGKLKATEDEGSVHNEEEQELGEAKVMVEKEEESRERNKEDDEENGEEESDSSKESNTDAIWPTEAMGDILLEIKQRKFENQILEEKTDNYIEVETKQNSLKNDTNNFAIDHCENENSGEALIDYKKRYIKERLLDPENTRTLIWGILVMVLALAAPLVFSLDGFMKISLVTIFVVSLAKVLQTVA